MNKARVIASATIAATLLSAWGTATAAPYSLLGWHQRSTGGALSSLLFKAGAAQGCPGPGYQQPCYNPAQGWTSTTGVATDVAAAGLPTFDWDGITLTESGLFQATSFINSNPNGTPVISDKIVGFSLTPGTSTTTVGTSYVCIEGDFLIGVGANGCLNVNLTTNTLESSAAYNVTGDPKCITRTVGGDDVSTGNVRGPINRTASPPCDATDGGFVQYVIVKDTGGVLILANQPNIGNCILFGLGPVNACPNDVSVASASYLVLVAPGALDTDGDGVPNVIDNCTLVANPNQLDANGDGYGNLCDGDVNNSGTVTSSDFGLLRSVLGQAWVIGPGGPPIVACPLPNTNCVLSSAADMNGSGTVTSADFGLLRARLGTVPGPSGLH